MFFPCMPLRFFWICTAFGCCLDVLVSSEFSHHGPTNLSFHVLPLSACKFGTDLVLNLSTTKKMVGYRKTDFGNKSTTQNVRERVVPENIFRAQNMFCLIGRRNMGFRKDVVSLFCVFSIFVQRICMRNCYVARDTW